MKQVILVEVNEVPNVVLDAYAQRSPFMRQFLESSDRYETVAADTIQLDPWIAWPSFHRGVPDTTHGLLRLGQDASRANQDFPPAWRLLKDAGLKVGVYGSLFSSSEEDIEDYPFFVPDVFSPHGRVQPTNLSRFQEFNLGMTRASARNPDKQVASGGKRAMAELALSGRLQAPTIARVAGQLANESLDKSKLSRRRNIQTELHADLFGFLVAQHKPHFATFYTNNVAAAMHRFWSASFRDKSINRGRLSEDWLSTYADEVFVAMDSVERLLRRLKRTAPQATIVLASAIGQEEIPAENHRAFVSISDIDAFVETLVPEARDRFSILPTMVPDFTVRFEDPVHVDTFRTRLLGFSIDGHKAIETLERMKAKQLVGTPAGLTHIRHEYQGGDHFKFPITFAATDARTMHLSIQLDDYAGPRQAMLGNRLLNFDDIGLGVVAHAEGVNCTAQHCAEGSLVVHGPGRTAGELEVVSALDFVPSLLAHFGVQAGAHLPGKASVTF